MPALLAPLLAAGLAADRTAGLGHALVAAHVVARSGSLTRRREALDAEHVIGWTFRATWFQRRVGLVTLRRHHRRRQRRRHRARRAGGRRRPARRRRTAGPGRPVPRLLEMTGPTRRRAAATRLARMFSKVLVANRGEIAIRAFRAAYEVGARTVAVFPLRGPLVRAPAEGRRGLRDRRARPPGAGLPRPRGDRRDRGARRGRRRLPRLRLPLREPDARRGLRQRRHHLRRPDLRGPRAHRQQGPRDRRGQGRRRPGAGAASTPCDRRRRAGRGGGGDAPPRCS